MNELLNLLKNVLAPYPPWTYSAAVAGGLLLLAFAVNFITKYILLRGLRKLLKALPARDAEERRIRLAIISRLANIVPALVLSYGATAIPDVHDTLETVIRNVCNAFIVLTSALALTRILDLIEIVYRRRPDAASKPIKGYLQLLKIFLSAVAVILIVATLINRNPLILLSGLGAMAAVLMLIFQDTILSLVASIQLGTNDMVRIGDWIEMPSQNADGDVTVRYYKNCFLTEAQTVELVLEPGYATEIHIFVKLPKMSLPVAPGDLTKVLGYWSGETANFNLHPIVDPTSGLISGLDCVADLTKFFTNYEDLVEIMDQSNSTIVWEWNDGSNSNEDGKDFFTEHASLDGKVHNLRQLKPEVIVTNDYDANEVTKEASFKIKAHFTALDGQDVSLSGDTPYNFTVTGVSSTWSKPAKPDLVFGNLGETLDLAHGCSWNIETNVGGGLVWKDGEEYFGVKDPKEDKAATLTTTFGYGKLFGFEAPTFEIEKITVDGTPVSAEEYKNYVNPITSDYKLSISEEGKQRITPTTVVVITVRVKAYSRFEKGPISGTDYTFTVTASRIIPISKAIVLRR